MQSTTHRLSRNQNTSKFATAIMEQYEKSSLFESRRDINATLDRVNSGVEQTEPSHMNADRSTRSLLVKKTYERHNLQV